MRKYGRFMVFQWDEEFNDPPFDCCIGDFETMDAAADLYLRASGLLFREAQESDMPIIGVFDCDERRFIMLSNSEPCNER